jgi:hypothetical protein
VRRIPPLAIALSIVSAAAWAQPASEALESMETCFHSARAADAICSDPANDPVKRLDCLGKARAAQLECLNKVLPGPAASEAPIAASPPIGSAAWEAPIAASPPSGSASSETPAAESPPDKPTGTVSQQPSAAAVAPEAPAAEVSSDPRRQGGPADFTTGSTSQPPAGSADNLATRGSNWVISETTSPLDYSPLIAAVNRSTSKEKDAPASMVVRCRGQRAEVLVGTQGTWRASRVREVQVDYQVDDRPVVRQRWMASEDGKTIRYNDDALTWLRSLPDDAQLKITVFDWQGPGHEALFQLAGLDVVRKKLELACRPTLAGDGAAPPAYGRRRVPARPSKPQP